MSLQTADEIGELQEENKELKAQIASLESEITRGENRISELEDSKDSGGPEDAILAVLDLVERPVGTMAATLPQTPASERALIALHDAVGRTL